MGNAAVSISVVYKEDTDRVGETLKKIAAQMRADPAFKYMILGDLELWGIDQIQGAVVTITGQIRCTDIGRWNVQREFNRRVKIKFSELGIRFANPTQTVLLEESERKADHGDQTDSKPAATRDDRPTKNFDS